jgi:hypothetical protein
MTTQLARYDVACRALAEAKSVDEVKGIHDVAAQMKVYARQAKNKKLEQDAVAIRMRAERRLGQLMKAQKEAVGLNQGAVPGKTGLKGNPVLDPRPTLASQGIDKNLAQKARDLSNKSEPEFEEAIEEARADIVAPKPKKPESSEPLASGELLDRLHDLAEELDLDQAQRLRALVNDLAAEREDLLAFARATLAAFEALSKHKLALSPYDLQLIEQWKICGTRVFKEKPGAEVPASAVPVADPSSATVAEAHAEPAGEVSSAPPAQDTPDDDDGLDIPESLRRKPATDGLQPIGTAIDKIMKGIG